MSKLTTYAFIDSQNLNLGVSNDVINQKHEIIYHGVNLNYRRFRHYLREKYGVSKAYLFIGYIRGNNKIYEYLQNCGYTLIFKEVVELTDRDGKTKVKGNVDTDIVLYAAAKTFDKYDRAIFVSGDGDFLSLYQYIDEKNKLYKILVPNRFRYSKLLRKYHEKIAFVSNQNSLFNKKTRSSGRITSLGMPGHRDKSSIAKSRAKVNRSKK